MIVRVLYKSKSRRQDYFTFHLTKRDFIIVDYAIGEALIITDKLIFSNMMVLTAAFQFKCLNFIKILYHHNNFDENIFHTVLLIAEQQNSTPPHKAFLFFLLLFIHVTQSILS